MIVDVPPHDMLKTLEHYGSPAFRSTFDNNKSPICLSDVDAYMHQVFNQRKFNNTQMQQIEKDIANRLDTLPNKMKANKTLGPMRLSNHLYPILSTILQNQLIKKEWLTDQRKKERKEKMALPQCLRTHKVPNDKWGRSSQCPFSSSSQICLL